MGAGHRAPSRHRALVGAPPSTIPCASSPPAPPLRLWSSLTGEKKARGLCPPRHTCYSPRSRLTCSDHERCPQLKRQSFRGGRFIYPPRGRTRCASRCAWIYTSRHSQNPTNPPQTEAPSLEIPLNALPELLRGGSGAPRGREAGGDRDYFFSPSPQSAAGYCSTGGVTAPHSFLPLRLPPPFARGFPSRPLLQRRKWGGGRGAGLRGGEWGWCGSSPLRCYF